MDDATFVFDKENAIASEFVVTIWNSLRQWLGVSFREPQPGERAGFDAKPPNIVFIVTPKFMANEQVREALEAACGSKRNMVFLHHIRTGCILEDELSEIPEECQKLVGKAIASGDNNRVVVYTEELYEECNDVLMTKLNLRDQDSLRKSRDARASARNLNIMKNSAKISKARTMATVKRKYDVVVTAAKEEASPDGMPVVADLYDTLCKLAPALTVGRNTGDKVTSADPRHSFNLVIILTEDALKCPQLLQDIAASLESEGNLMFVHHIESCTSFEDEVAKCEDKVLTSLILRAARFPYLEGACASVVNGMLIPGNVKTDDAKSPRTKQALSSGGGKSYKLEYKNQFSLALAGDGTGEIYNTKFSDKPKPLPGDIDGAIKALFELYDPEKKGTISFPQFAEVDRIVTESLGGQYNEMISRRMYSMMNYPGLTLEANISFTTFHNYHLYVAKQMGAMEGDKDASMHYKYIVDKVKNAKKGKRYQNGKLFDLFITHDGSKPSLDLARSVKRSIQAHTPNIRVALCNEKVPGRAEMTHALMAAAALNVLLLLSENCLKNEACCEDLIEGANAGAQVLVMTHLCVTQSFEAEKKKGSANVQAVLARPPVVEYWKKCDSACCVKLLEMLAFPLDANNKRPLPNRGVVFRKRDNAAVLYLYQGCDEDTDCAHALTALGNLVSPISKSADGTREEFQRDGGLEILAERFQQFASVPSVAEVACRAIANLAQSTSCSRRMAELGTVKLITDVITSHSDAHVLQGEACRAIVNLSQDEYAKKVINDLGGFQLMLQSQKRFEFNPEFWEMRWGIKQMEEGTDIMVNYHGKGLWCSAKIARVNKGNGTYDVTYAHGGNEAKVPAQLVRAKDKTDQMEEFATVWQWKPNGRLTEDELTLKNDTMITLKSQGQGAAGTWKIDEDKKTPGRYIVKINISGDLNTIEMERISLTTLRSTNGPQRAVLKELNEDCLYVEYFKYGPGSLKKKPPSLLGRMPDIVREEQQIQWPTREGPEQLRPWTGLPEKYTDNYATRWKGVLEITRMGEYEFTLTANTGASLWLNEKLAVKSINSEPVSTTLQMVAGPQRLCLVYSCKDSSVKEIDLSYKGPDTDDEVRVVPVAVLQHSKEACGLVQKPGMIAEYWPEDFDNGNIPEEVEPDIIRVEKQLDFDETMEPWQGLPPRYKSSFSARYTFYVNVTCGDAKKANYSFSMDSGKKGKLFVNDKLLVLDDTSAEIELKKGNHLCRVEYFNPAGDQHGLKLYYQGPETMPAQKEGEEDADPNKGIVLIPPTATSYFNLPSCAFSKGDPMIKHSKTVGVILWSPKDTRIASAGKGGKVQFWDPPTGSWLAELDLGFPIDCGCNSKDAGIAALALTDVDHSIQLIDFEKGTKIRQLTHEKKPPSPEQDEDEEGGGAEEEPTGHEATVTALSFSPDDTLLASCSEDGVIKVWDVQTGNEKFTQCVRVPQREGGRVAVPVNTVAFTGDNNRIITGGNEKILRLWDIQANDAVRAPKKLKPKPEHPDGPDGVWAEGEEPPDEWELGEAITISGHVAPVTCISFSPKDKYRFASCSTDATIRIWDLIMDAESASMTPVIHPIQCLSNFVQWSPDAATLVSSSEDINVQLWSAVSGKQRADGLKGHNSTVRWSCWAPSGQCFASCSDDQSIRLWHFLVNRNITEIAELEGEQMVFNADMRNWGELLMHIRMTFNNYKKGRTDYATDIYKLREALDHGKVRTNSFIERERLLGLTVTDYYELDGMIDDYAPSYQLWNTVISFQQSEMKWTDDPISELDSVQMENLLDQWYKDVYKMIKSFDNDNMRKVQSIAKDLKNGIEDFKTRFPFLRAFATPSVLPRHWEEMFKRMDIPKVAEYDRITLKMMLDANILDFTNDFEELSTAAAKEAGLKRQMGGMKTDWGPLEFGTNPRNGVPLLKGIDDIQTVLDDHISKTQAIRSSPFCKPFEEEVHKWEATLMYLQDFIDQTIALQRSWMALEPIFISDDIKRQLPNESASFSEVDAKFRKRMKEVDETRNCIKISEIENITEDMTESNNAIEKVQKGLKDYLETKRNYFPRFFFLNDADLLSILAETKDPTLVQPHLGKAFEGVAKVRFDSGNSIIEAMISAETESVNLTTHVDVNKPGNKGAVEKWLLELEELMMNTLRDVSKKSNDAYASSERHKWCCEWPGQVVLLTDCIYWTAEVTEALKGRRIADYEQKLFKQLDDIVMMVRGDMSKLNRVTVGAMVTIDVHARDVITDIVKAKVDSPEDFAWLQQLRYYWQDVGEFVRVDTQQPNTKMECKTCIVNSTLLYGFEYLGNTPRLVITPLTDRCYRTLMGAFALYYGGAPEGPAGTGKTESTKDLAKALAIQCVVFNCSDSMDYLQLAKFFKGLASSGSWCCFDEFNRISLEVLSVVAQQIQQISLAIKRRVDKFIFEETEIRLIPTCAVNITMNPGYAGRSELPDNLKALFRPVAMMVPNYALISEIRLYSAGYSDAKRIGMKATMALKLSSEQLSPQKHYDFGMRGLNALLVAGANGKRTYGDSYPEDVIALRSFTDVNLPKFTTADLPLFKGIIGDLFPGVELPPSNTGKLLAAMDKVVTRNGLQPVPSFTTKTVQLWETVLVRHGLMTVGIPPCGKTKVKNVLAETLADIADGGDTFMPVTQYVMNPKAITQGQLYGEADLNTQEWTDGVLAIAVREAAKAYGDGRRQWVVLDGPVDAIWIENMNTVLDDNKKLCLNSGEIIKLSIVTTMLFEVRDLEFASPATVSRVGIVFLEPDTDLGWKPIVDSWLKTLPEYIKEVHADQLQQMFHSYFPVMLECTHRMRTPFAVSDGWLCCMATRLMESLMCDRVEPFCKETIDFPEGEAPDDDDAKGQSFDDREQMIAMIFWFVMIWTCGACTDVEGRSFFGDIVRGCMDNKKDMLKKHNFFEDFTKVDFIGSGNLVMPPRKGLIHDLYVDATDNGKWKPWTERIEGFDIPKDTPYHTIVVPTADTVRNQFLIRTLIEKGHHILISGPTGTAKTASIQGMLLQGFSPDSYSTTSFAFSAQTTANMTQDVIDGRLDKRKKGTFGPPPGKKMLVFIDDLNMPFKEEYGAQPPIEILRHMFILTPFGFGWYDRKGWEFRQLVDIHMLAAMCPPGAGKNDITDRYSRMFNLVFVTPFDEESLNRIFSTVVGKFLSVLPRDVAGLSGACVSATLEVYTVVLKEMLPTPAKSHYTFNMRDVSKVFQGICQCSRESLPKADDLTKVWVHECERVFKDRLVTKQDMNMFFNLCKRQMDRHFKKQYDQVVKLEPIIFADFVDQKSTSYMEVTDHNKLQDKVGECLEDYNSVSKIRMDLVLFTSFIQHVCRVIRVLKLPLGNALLVGVGGSGRKSTTTLATYVANYTLFQIEITKGYGLNEWHDDIKKMLMTAGCANTNMVFLFSDTQIAKEAFLEEVSSILNTGEVPNLYANEDKLEITEKCSKGANAVGKNGPSEIFAWYVEQCRKNLHIVNAMSPIGAAFRNRLRSFPSLVNCCTIDWFHEWPADALHSVATQFLSSDKDLEFDDALTKKVTKVMVEAQMTVQDLTARMISELKRYFYVTPTSYLELINSFIATLKERRQMVMKAKWRYDTGLEKINDAKEQVSALQIELNDLEPVLEKAAQETGEMRERVEAEQAGAVEKKTLVEEEEAKANVQKAAASEIKADCEKDLAAALPAYESAVEALSKLSKGDVGEVRGMKTPPAGVVLTAQAMCIMFEVKPVKVAAPDGKGKVDDFWEAAKKELLADPRLLEKMVNFDKDNIPESVIAKVKPLYDDQAFDPDIIKKASLAAMGICKWVRAMVVYDKVAKEVGPKKAKLAKAEAEVAEAEATVAAKQQELAEVLAMVADLEAQLNEANEKAKELQRNQKDCAAKLARAEKLIDGLGGEQASWSQKSSKLQKDYTNLTGDILIASGIIAYLGIFTGSYRQEACTKWLGELSKLQIPASKEFKLENCIGDQVKIRQWVIDALPNDSLSIDNAIILDNSRRWPLMIDPQGQANKWVRRSNAESLKIIRLSMNYVRDLEMCIQFGTPVLLENIENTLDAILDPVLQKATFKQGTLLMVRLGDSTIEWSKDFRFYITTKLPNPHFPPEICVAVGILNFMATLDGLQDQMLGTVVAQEEPETEAKRVALVLESAKAKAQLKELEDKILALLSSSTGNILDDEELIETLSSSKIMGTKIEEQVKQQEITGQQIQEVRQVYKYHALRCAALYFVVGDLCITDPMYQFSLDWFNMMFVKSIEEAEQKDNKEERFTELFRSFISLLFVMVSRGLFEKDKLLYALMLTLKCQEIERELKLNEVMALITGLPGKAKEDKPAGSDWLTMVSWNRINALQSLGDVFDGFIGEFSGQIAGWQVVFDSDDPVDAEWPNNFKMKCSPLQAALLLFALRPDGTVKAFMNIVEAKLGRFFLEPPPLNLELCYKDSNPGIPLIYILAMGSDPMADIQRLAEGMDMLANINPISLGQGQGPKAIAGIKDGSKNGKWVLLQNCHLAPSFMTTLEGIVEAFVPDEMDPMFRLWLTACPSPDFPISILQSGIKMTIEPPKGLKQAMLRSYLSIDEEWFESCTKPFEFKKMLCGLFFFHGLILERRGFGPVGWNNQYGFSEPDRDISRLQLKIFLDEFEGVPYEALNYMVSEANYGGRVTDGKDRVAIVCILKDFYCPDILETDYKFSISGLYYSPEPGTLAEVIDHVKAMPIQTTPEAFWLHQNASLTAAINEGLYISKSATAMMGSFGAAAGGGDEEEENVKQKTPEEQYSEIAADVVGRIPEEFDLLAALRAYPVERTQCLNTVLLMELGKFNRLRKRIYGTCSDLGKAVKGLVVFSPELEQVAEGCLQNKIPPPWMGVSYPSLKPFASYVDEFLLRWKFMTSWVKDGIPFSFWFSAFFFQQCFLTGVIQNFARSEKIAIDRCMWNYKVMKEAFKPEENPPAGAYIHGLVMNGGRWDDDNMYLEDSFPKVLWCDMSSILCKPVEIDNDETDPSKQYMCPVYKTSERKGVLSTSGHSSNYIMDISLDHKPEKPHDGRFWTKRGLALITMTDD
jgi:dynein heavy chain